MNYLLVIFIKLLSYFPLYILRLLSKLFYIINLLVIRYRFKVVYNNLKLVFPKKNHNELKELRDLFFKYFFNLIIEIIKMITVVFLIDFIFVFLPKMVFKSYFKVIDDKKV